MREPSYLMMMVVVFIMSCAAPEAYRDQALRDSSVAPTVTTEGAEPAPPSDPPPPVPKEDPCVKALVKAAGDNQLEAVRELLDQGCPVDATIQTGSDHRRSALAAAVMYTHPAMVELLLSRGADPNLDLDSSATPFETAAAGASLEILQRLHQAGGVITSEPKRKGQYATLLIQAVANAEPANVQYLLEQGADPNAAGGSETPLAWAMMRANEVLVALLLDHGADPNVPYSEASEDCWPCPNGITVLHGIVNRFTWEDSDVEKLDRILQVFVDHGADVNQRDVGGDTPLDWALTLGDARLARKLLAFGAKPSVNSLHNAVRFSHPDCARLLLDRGVDVNARDERGETPLIACLTCCGDGFGEGIDPGKRRETVALLLDHGADLEATDRNGESFLQLARRTIWRMSVVELLIERGFLQWSDVIIEDRVYQYEPRWVNGDPHAELHSHPSLQSPVVARIPLGTEVKAAFALSTYWPSTQTEEIWMALDFGGIAGFLPGELLNIDADTDSGE